jgi:hypothetical protein
MRSMAQKARNAIVEAVRFLLGRQSGPGDPYAPVRVPIKRGPPDKHASVALAEPD